MRPQVLIIEDSPFTADLARLALADVPCEVTVAAGPAHALAMVTGPRLPWVMVIDGYLPGVQPHQFVIRLCSAAPRASVVLLLERGQALPPLPLVTAWLPKPLQPRRFASVIEELIATHDGEADEPES